MKERVEALQNNPLLKGVALDPEATTEHEVESLEQVVKNSNAALDELRSSVESIETASAEKDQKIRDLEQLANDNLGDSKATVEALTSEKEALEATVADLSKRLAAAEARAKQAGARPQVEVDGKAFEVIGSARIVKGELKGAYTAEEIARNSEVASYLVELGSGVMVSLDAESEND